MGLQLSKKTLISAGVTALVVAAAVAASLGGDTSAEATERISACLLGGVSEARSYQLGETFGASGKVTWRPLETITCPGFLTFVGDTTFREVIGEHTGRTLLLSPDFRKGMYAGYGAAFALPAAERQKLGELGMYLEAGLKPAVTAKYCEAFPPNGADYLENIIYPFTLAAVGNQAPSLSDESVYKTAEFTLDSVRDAANYDVEAGYDCSPEKNVKEVEKLITFLEAMGRFREGKHELAPGCSADVRLDTVTLKCVGPDGSENVSKSVAGAPVD